MPDSLETLRFVLLGDDRASSVFSRFARQVDETTKALDKDNIALLAVKKQLDDLGKLTVNPKIDLKDLTARTKLDEIKLRLAQLNSYVADPRISLQGLLRARLEIDRLQAKLNDLNNMGGGGFLSKI